MNIPLKTYWTLLARHIQPQMARFWLLTVLLLSSIGLQVVNPQIVRQFIDAAQAGAAIDSLLASALLFLGVALIQQIVTVSATYVGENVAWTATNQLRAELADHCLHLDMTFHNNTSPGQLIERIDGDVAELSNFFSQLVIRVVGNIILLVGVLAVLAVEDWRLGIAFTVFAIVALLLLNQVRSLAVPYQKQLRAAVADLFGFLEERLTGTEDIRSSGAVDFVLRELYQFSYVILGHWRNVQTRFLILRLTGGLLLTLANVIAIVSGYTLFRSGLITLGTVYLIIQYTNVMGRPIRELTQQTENLQNIGAATERLAELRSNTSSIEDGPGARLPDGPLALDFEHVSFSYVEGEPVLKDIRLNLTPGTTLGILGRTGSGKTTLARLVLRLYDPSEGYVSLGGIDIRQLTLSALRQRVAIVTQDVQLFEASVRDNLTFFDRSIPDDRIRAVIDELELADWYRTLPHGLDTELETGGRGLSAGEGQLLAFTRVFLRDPGLVILDEASSRLDPATEARIERAIDKLLHNRTAIIIAHRLSTVHRAHEIAILDRGMLIEHGHREGLASDPTSRFHHLLQTGLEEVLA
ncbi:MAG: ABC transporter ATP-binding protein [Chloroflexi bacterium]|nr:ABC transporter ATP-binding protein [Chloroflexota bacterium]